MKNIPFLLVLSGFLAVSPLFAQQTESHYIEVTGSAEMSVIPDEIRVTINLTEYWEEEYEKSKEFRDYRTRVEMIEIEKEFRKALEKAGISKEQVQLMDVGNSWRYRGKDFMNSKQYEITLHNFGEVEKLAECMNFRGMASMMISDLRNERITEFRQQVKEEALKAACDKAGYLLGCVNKKTGEILQIEEIEEENNSFRQYNSYSSLSNSFIATPEDDGNDNGRKIRLRYKIRARFAIL